MTTVASSRSTRLAPNLAHVEVDLDVDRGSLMEKAAAACTMVERAVRADLARYKALIGCGQTTPGHDGVIEDGAELVRKPHNSEYDEERDYSDVEDLRNEAEESGDEDDDDNDDEPVADEDLPRDGTGRFKGAGAKPMSKTAASSSGSSSRSSGGTRRKSSSSSGSNGNGKTTAKSSSGSKPTAKRTSGSTRKRGSSNGSGSTQKRSATPRRRASSRS